MSGQEKWAHIKSAYLAQHGFEEQLLSEVSGICGKSDRLYFSTEPAIPALWAQNIWLNPQVITIESVGQAAKTLQSLGRLWHPHIGQWARRIALIQEKLPYFPDKRAEFGGQRPSKPLGSFTLLEQGVMLASPICSSLRAEGAWEFVENKTEPPSRAYLKLWEFFSRLRIRPKAGSKCLEIGASPGGWSWVLLQLGACVEAIDRSPLDSRISGHKNLVFNTGDGFHIKPEDKPEVNWVFSDVIAYPPRLLEWIKLWLNSDHPVNMVCTIKLQERKHYELIEEFKKLSGAAVIHLYHNKHEITWYSLRDPDSCELF